MPNKSKVPKTQKNRRWFFRTSALAVTAKAFESTALPARATSYERKVASPQWRDGKFRNDLPEMTDFTKALAKLFTAQNQTPSIPIPTVSRSKSDFLAPIHSGLRVTWLGHSTLLVEIEGKKFLTDPVWAERASPVSFAGPKRFFPVPLALDQLPPLDAIILSHDHYDHYCSETLKYFAKAKIPFFVPLGVGERLEELGVDHDRIFELDWWGIGISRAFFKIFTWL